MPSTIEERKTEKSTRRLPLLIVVLVAIIGLTIWAFASGLVGAGSPTTGPANGNEGTGAVAAGADQDHGPAEPITTFDGAKSGDWPAAPEDSVGCGYVTERLTDIKADVQAEGATALRGWLDAMSDLQADPTVADANAQFDAVKRVWSTALASGDEEGNIDQEQLTLANQALEDLITAVDCN